MKSAGWRYTAGMAVSLGAAAVALVLERTSPMEAQAVPKAFVLSLSVATFCLYAANRVDRWHVRRQEAAALSQTAAPSPFYYVFDERTREHVWAVEVPEVDSYPLGGPPTADLE